METVARRHAPDDLDRYVAERAGKSPNLPALVVARTNRRVIQRQLAERRVALGMTQTEAAVLMRTAQSSIARLESGEHDVRLGTLERYAAVLSCSLEIQLIAS
jgi:DNA-binding XRE family transcriptional regulator